ncbi:hypothetical protein A0J61_04422 [Choanephora cucurbitarum]|uniref:Uncharacterized protein n=1 Tax=Choanephora cucurbitarum TaxID=101091 RepID=A0A1C7NG36_9FUNG|nr:hypothetical protein A0J61_04422 [Choanephora cucurbitarum]
MLPSLSSDAKVVQFKLEKLPYINPLSLRDLIIKRFAHFRAGPQLDGRSFFGQGCVILYMNRLHPTE